MLTIGGCIFAVFAASSLWSIRELFQQEKRVEKGWFPKKDKKPEFYLRYQDRY